MSVIPSIPEPWKTDPVWTILDFTEERPKIVLNPMFQRSDVWPPPKQRLLVDSILRDWEIGRILLHAGAHKRAGDVFEPFYEVIDGQQRIRAIFKFLDGELAIPQFAAGIERIGIYTIMGNSYDLRGKKWTDDDFPEQVRMKFYSYKMSVKVYQNKSEQEIAQIFVRVQEGLPLSSSEKLNAVLGYVRDEIRDLSEHKLLRNTGISPFRFNRRWIVAHIVYHEINDFTEQGFRKAYYTDLMKMYNQHREKSRKSRQALKKVKKTFNYLNRQLGDRANLLKKNPDFITLSMICSYLHQKNYVIEGASGLDWADFVETFLLKVAKAKVAFKSLPEGQSLPADLLPYYRYETNRRREGKNEITERFEFMIEKFLERYPKIDRRDPQRLFDEYQKRVIFKKADGSCQEPQDSECAGKTTYGEGEADHTKPWIAGGPTSIENGQWLCKHCNRVKHSRMQQTHS